MSEESTTPDLSALELGRRMIAGWNKGDLRICFSAFDPYVAVRPDRNWPERLYAGKASAEGFWRSTRETMGGLEVSIEEERDLGDRAYFRVHQPVRSRSGVQGAYSWTFIVTVREGQIILVEFFIDDAAIRAELGIAEE
ncbi:MAG TPA: nuclear transport factor 2 family protein [Solirubrobacteraceae bacterium]|nr:nuclear transport factor 2 family protein [Solirubrobacteraceae bacterium]